MTGSPTHNLGPLRGVKLARAHGAFNVVSGLWPLVHRRSFEALLGPKADYWLVETVAGLMIANGLVQVSAPGTSQGVHSARRVGVGTAAVLAAIDLAYATRGRISRVYLLDAAAEAAWLTAWALAGRRRPRTGGIAAGA